MSNFSFNQVILGGRLSNDPDLRTTSSGISVCHFTLAVPRSRKKDEEPKTDFVSIVVWRQLAEFAAKYFQKGSACFVVGNLKNAHYTDKNNVKHYKDEVEAKDIRFIDAKSDRKETEETTDETSDYPSLNDLSQNGDLPFYR